MMSYAFTTISVWVYALSFLSLSGTRSSVVAADCDELLFLKLYLLGAHSSAGEQERGASKGVMDAQTNTTL